MKIKIIANDLPFWLVGNPAAGDREHSESGADTAIQMPRNQEVKGGAGYELKVTFIDRGNQSISIDATTTMQFDDEMERMDFIARLAPLDEANALHPWSGRVVVREGPNTGWKEWEIPTAIISLAGAPVLVGAAGLQLRYRVQGGGFDAGYPGMTDTIQALALAGGHRANALFDYAGGYLTQETLFINVVDALAEPEVLSLVAFIAIDTDPESVGEPSLILPSGPFTDHVGDIVAFLVANGIDAVIEGSGFRVTAPSAHPDSIVIIQVYGDGVVFERTAEDGTAAVGLMTILIDANGIALLGDIRN